MYICLPESLTIFSKEYIIKFVLTKNYFQDLLKKQVSEVFDDVLNRTMIKSDTFMWICLIVLIGLLKIIS